MRTSARAILLIAAVVTAPLAAQEAVPSRLSLEDALEIARGNNPGFLQTRNDEALADWDVRQAHGYRPCLRARASRGKEPVSSGAEA